MKAKDIRTIKSLINEYGMTQGVSTPVGQQKSGDSAKASAANRANKSTINKPSQSPTSQQVKPKDAQQPEQPQEPKISKASELEKDFEFADDKGDTVKVISPVGQGKNKDALIVQNQNSKEYYTMQPDDEVTLPVEESNVSKILNKQQRSHMLHRKIKKLIRKKSLSEQGSEQLFEINFNNKEIAKAALDLPIKCGFEAETAFTDVGGSDDDDGDWLENYGWYDIEDMVRDQEGSRSANEIEESYNEWISEKAYDYEGEIIEDLVSDREEDEYYLNDYIENEISESDVEDYKEDFLDGMDSEEREEYEDWEYDAWARQYVEENFLEDYKDWLRESIRDEGEAMDQAFDRARDEYDIDRWANYEYGSWASCLSEHGIYLYNPDGPSGGGLSEVSERLEDWTSENSTTRSVQYGDYHSNYGANNDFWRVESDSSIDADYGTGAEIISPVYSTPRAMLKEMKSLFEWIEDQGADTNSSTGLHVTMSLDSEETEVINDVKLAVLLGDKYLLSTFGRERNSYAKSQMIGLQKAAARLKSNPDAKTIKQIEKILKDGIARDKFSSINFKSDKDRNTGNQLIEFRIGGGSDYHRDFNTAAKAVIRYATTMQAAYSDKLYNADYAKALFRLINSIDRIDPADEERAKSEIEHPVIDVLKGFFSKENYVENMHRIGNAFKYLEKYKKLSAPDADKKWKRDIENYEKGTGEKVDIEEVEQAEPFNAYIRPDSSPPSKRAQAMLNKAQESFIISVGQAGYDLSQNLNRDTATAKNIGIMRNALKEFELSYEKISNLILSREGQIFIQDRRDLKPQQIIGRIKHGVDKLFRKDVVKEPEYVSSAQVEKVIQGMWNAVNSDELQDSNKSMEFVKALAGIIGGKGRDTEEKEDYAAAWLDQLKGRGANREYKEFHGKVLRGSYSEEAIIKPGSPIDKKALNKFLDHLKTYPEWNHPVAKGHNPNVTGDDSYRENATSKMMQKLRLRWEALDEIRESDPGLYIDSLRELGDLLGDLVETNRTEEDFMSDIDDDLHGTDHQNERDGPAYLGIRPMLASTLDDLAKEMKQPRANPFGDSVVLRARDNMQEYLAGSFDRYYTMKSRHSDGYYKIGSIPEIIKQRSNAIKKFLDGFDKIAQKVGFDSQSNAINNKLKLDKKQKKFNKKHGSRHVAKVDGFNYGGNIFVTIEFHDRLGSMNDSQLAADLEFFNNIHRSTRGSMLRIPNAHYFTALDATEVLEREAYRGTWREKVAKQILQKFYDTYRVQFSNLDNHYVDINNYGLKQNLKDRNVEFTDKLGDGRIGMGQFAPLLPKKELEGPYGEPFSPSSAVSWKLNNPELAKKIDADEKKRRNSIDVQIPKAAGVEGMETYSSSTIADNTNWKNLAKNLKIEAGVNDQGVNLLKKAYDQFDSNHNWRPEPDPDVCCMPRYVAAVKAAKEYIEKNYTVSGGNYFRKNADGSIGDDVSGVYGGSENFSLGELDSVEITANSYAEARGNYEKFDQMMQTGVGNYIVTADTNRLVKFLVGDFSEQYKRGVLKALIYNRERGGEPADIQQALALGRNNMESVFDKFNNLNLQEQIDLVAKVDKNKIDEAWSKKYKDSINCSNPKGFSQKAHCAGKKKANEGDVIKNKFAMKQAQKGKDKYRKTDIEIPTRDGEPYDRFDYKETESGSNAHIIGIIGNKGYKISTAPLQLAKTLVDMYNRGGFTDKDIKQLDPKDVFEDQGKRQFKRDELEHELGHEKNNYAVIINGKTWKVVASKSQAQKMVQTLVRKGKDARFAETGMPLSEGAVPNNDSDRKIKQLLSKPLLASDLKAQMEAYFVIPDPSMIHAFRSARAHGGDDVDLRSVFRGFINTKAHPSLKKKVGIKESVLKEDDRDQERFNFIIDKLKQHPEFIQRVYRFIKTDVKNSERVHPQDFLQPERTAPETDYSYKGVLPEFVKAIMNTDGDFDDIENFLASYGKVSYVNSKVLMTDGATTWDQWLQGGEGVSVQFITELYDNLFNIALNIEGSNRGPGEVGLALLSPNITFASVGDLMIDGEEVEVKGEKSSGGGRLKNSNADYGQPNLDAVYQKFNIQDEDKPQRLPSGNAGSRPGTHFLDIATQLDTLAAGAGQAYIKELFTATYKYGDKQMINYMINNYSSMDRADASALAGEISYSSYANILKGKGFSKFLFLKAPGKKSLAFDVDDYKNHLDKFKLGSLDWGDKMNGPAVQVSMR